jgi:hypothetical protein
MFLSLRMVSRNLIYLLLNSYYTLDSTIYCYVHAAMQTFTAASFRMLLRSHRLEAVATEGARQIVNLLRLPTHGVFAIA